MDRMDLGIRFSMSHQSFGATANTTAMGNSSFGFASPAVSIPYACLHYTVVGNTKPDVL